MSKIGIECKDCGNNLSENQRPCPYCGSIKRSYYASAKVTIGIQCSTKVKHKNSRGFLKLKSIGRNKTSDKTKRKAQETQVYDKTDPQFTKKLHHVEEISEDGQAEVVHHEEVKFPAKRRTNNFNQC